MADPFENIKIREEDFGGILYNAQSDTVYRVNHSGFRLFNDLRAKYREGKKDLHAFKSPDFRPKDVKKFVDYLHKQAIWKPR